jgi:signal transduction histidine kinase
VRSPQSHPNPKPSLRQRIERLDGLPLRPATARFLLETLPEDASPPIDPIDFPKLLSLLEIDPGWALARAISGPDAGFDPLALIAGRPWWPRRNGPQAEALDRHWRHAVAVSQAARRLAREAGDPEPERVARAGLLHGLGRWAVAAIDPQWLVEWLDEADPKGRREFERRTLGREVTELGRILAERWGCDPLLADAAWLSDDVGGSFDGCATEPEALALIRQALGWAERTPWAIAGPGPRDLLADEPRLRLLMAEVQVRCGPAFVDPDADLREERLSRSNARLRGQLARLRAGEQSRDRFLDALIRTEPGESPEAWAERAGFYWCNEPGIASARVVWADTGPSTTPPAPTSSPTDERPAGLVVPFRDRRGAYAEVHLWSESGRAPSGPEIASDEIWKAWRAWAGLVAERVRLSHRLEDTLRVHRDQIADEEIRIREAKLEALAEFAAGAGHELNNPLAVIVGRAQLLLARTADAAANRSLRAIINQAQRAHRILRDLMYVARPPVPRPRICHLDEIVRHCLRDLKEAADEREIRLVAEVRGIEPKVWADPDAIRHVMEISLRNALEATPSGGVVELTASSAADGLSWSVRDSGKGVGGADATHLFDPFYSGRQAGRGLGLGLPRAARVVSQIGGEIRWHTAPLQGTVFRVHLPSVGPPNPTADLAASSLPSSKENSSLHNS